MPVNLKKLIIPYSKFIRDIMIYDKAYHNTGYDIRQIEKQELELKTLLKSLLILLII